MFCPAGLSIGVLFFSTAIHFTGYGEGSQPVVGDKTLFVTACNGTSEITYVCTVHKMQMWIRLFEIKRRHDQVHSTCTVQREKEDFTKVAE